MVAYGRVKVTSGIRAGSASLTCACSQSLSHSVTQAVQLMMTKGWQIPKEARDMMWNVVDQEQGTNKDQVLAFDDLLR